MENDEIEELLEGVRIPSDEEVEAAGRRFDRRLWRVRMRRRFVRSVGAVAAVVCCGLLVVAPWMWGEVEEMEVARVEEMPRVSVPTLILADGCSLNLREKGANALLGESNIRIEENRIVYDTLPVERELVYNTLVIPAGFTYNAVLADGTEVVLNAGSSLKYPEEFVGELREVELSGEAYFNVTKSDVPFEICVGGAKIRVYGTRFNVKERLRKSIETVLVEGKIGFQTPSHDEVQVAPGERVAFNRISGDMKVETVDVKYAMAWLDGVFRYRDAPLNLVLEDISAWYGVEFDARTDLNCIEVTMNLSKQTTINEVIMFLEKITSCTFTGEGGCYIVK